MPHYTFRVNPPLALIRSRDLGLVGMAPDGCRGLRGVARPVSEAALPELQPHFRHRPDESRVGLVRGMLADDYGRGCNVSNDFDPYYVFAHPIPIPSHPRRSVLRRLIFALPFKADSSSSGEEGAAASICWQMAMMCSTQAHMTCPASVCMPSPR